MWASIYERSSRAMGAVALSVPLLLPPAALAAVEYKLEIPHVSKTTRGEVNGRFLEVHLDFSRLMEEEGVRDAVLILVSNRDGEFKDLRFTRLSG